MQRYSIYLIAFFTILSNVVTGATSEKSVSSDKKLRTYVSILPQSFFVERIGGDNVYVELLVEPGRDPHTFEPTPKQMIALGESDLYFGIGFPFEEQILKKVQGSNPNFVLIKTDAGVTRRTLDEHHHTHETENEFHYEEIALDPHIWLSYPEIKMQMINIYESLVKYDPDNAQTYKENFNEFLSELDEVHERLKKTFSPHKSKPFFVFHPAFGYFADTYGLIQIPIEIEGKNPTPKQIESIIINAKEKNISIIFVSPQFDRRSAQTIADAIDGAVVSINPLEKNVLRNLEEIAKKIRGSFK